MNTFSFIDVLNLKEPCVGFRYNAYLFNLFIKKHRRYRNLDNFVCFLKAVGKRKNQFISIKPDKTYDKCCISVFRKIMR